MEYREETCKAYNTLPDYLWEKFDRYLKEYLQEEVNEFLKRMPENGTILDIGSGPGYHGLFFKEKNLDVICIDISERMVRKCKEKGLEAKLMDFENLDFDSNNFDGIWANASLLHVPKRNLDSTLKQIYKIMKNSGVFFIGMKEGFNEGFKNTAYNQELKRWFSLYYNEELRKYFDPYFNIQFFSRKVLDKDRAYLNYILTKKGLKII